MLQPQEFYYAETEWGLHVTNTSSCLASYETTTRTMKNIIEMCVEKKPRRILCEGHRKKPIMSLIELYRTGRNLMQWQATGFRIAYLMPELVDNEDMLFFETVGENRSIFITLFADKARALGCLNQA